MFVSGSTRCFADKPFAEACDSLTDLEYSKIEIWIDDSSQHLTLSQVVDDPDDFLHFYRETTRLTPVALSVANQVDAEQFANLCRTAKLLKLTQITIPSSPLGTPFNEEIDRLREAVRIATADGVRVSILTETGHLTEDPHTAVELCQSVKGLGLTFDPSYYIVSRCDRSVFERIYPHVFHTHLRDTSTDELQVQVGLGELDYNKLISQLERHNYRLALSVELIPEKMDLSHRPLEMRKLRMLLESLL